MSEEEIVREICKGGRARDSALRALYDGCAQHMLRFFVYHGASSDEAQDILQETVLKVVRSADTYRGDGAARSWIWQIARNCLANHQRNAGRGDRHVVTVDPEQWETIKETVVGPPDCAAGETAEECVSRGLEAFAVKMPERALALTLQMERFSVAEIGQRLGRTEAATKTYLYECRLRLAPFVAHCTELLTS
jgi:RNA polymerase sigma factor (sigma-70 family)